MAMRAVVQIGLRGNDDGGEIWTEARINRSGIVHWRVVDAQPWRMVDCLCCSCGDDRALVDPYCREHGTEGFRPCDDHGMSGSDDAMPSVQDCRARRAG